MVLAAALHDTLRRPVVRRATIALPYMPRGQAPVRLVFISDLHVIDPDMPPSRLATIVAQINALRPDIVLIGGDFTSERLFATRRYTPSEAVAPLGALRARYGTAAVLGNHDGRGTGADDMRSALEGVRVRVIANDVVRIGPITVVGRGEAPGSASNWQAVFEARLAKQLGPNGGPPFVGLAHMSFEAVEIPQPVSLLLAGHTHCGQIAIPWTGYWGAAPGVTRCGINRVDGRLLLMSAGLGQSTIPLRLGVPPDIWLLTLVPGKQTGPIAVRPGPR